MALTSEASSDVAKLIDEDLSRLRPEQVRTVAAWDRWWVLVGVFALWSVAWGVRRNRGLV